MFENGGARASQDETLIGSWNDNDNDSTTNKNNSEDENNIDYLSLFLDDPKYKVDSQHAQQKWELKLRKGTKVLIEDSHATVVKTTGCYIFFVLDGNERTSSVPDKRVPNKIAVIEY